MRHEARSLCHLLGDGGTACQARGIPLTQDIVAGGEVVFPPDMLATLQDRLGELAGRAQLRAVGAIRAHARESITLIDAHWRDIRCAVEDAGDGRTLRVRVTVRGIAERSLGGDALVGAAMALAVVAEAAMDAVIGDLRILAIDIEGRGRHVHANGLPVDVAGRLPEPVLALRGTRCAVVTLSDRASRGVYEDRSGDVLAGIIATHGGTLAHRVILPDERERLAVEIEVLVRRGDIDLVLCTGGTGIGPRDITPDTLQSLNMRPVPGIGELLRAQSAQVVRSAWLSRTIAGTLGNTLVVALPGSHKAVAECMEFLLPLLPHTFSMLHGGDHRPVQNGSDHRPAP